MSRAAHLKPPDAPDPGRSAPGPRGAPLLGSALDLRRRGQLQFYLQHWRTYGDVVRFRLGPFVGHILAHPEHIHHVLAGNASNYRKGPSYEKARLVLGSGLLTSEGDLWRRHRRLLQPPFTHRSVLQFGGAMADAVDEMMARWEPAIRSRSALAVDREMARLTLSILGKAIFGTNFDESVEAVIEAAAEAETFVNRRLGSAFDLPLIIPTPANRRFVRALRSFDAFVYRLIEQRRRQVRAAPDLLGQLLAAQDDETGIRPDARQIRDEVITILLAGHETSALALTWTWYLLSRHREVEEKLRCELTSVLNGRSPTLEDLPALPYTRMVVEESLRLYPPVWTFPRAAIANDVIGGYHIPAGSLIFPSQYLAHRHPAFWEHPETFDPERFSPDRARDRLRQAYFPFGGGPRTCIGVHLAMAELCFVLATIARPFRLPLLPGPPIEPISRVTLHPSRPVLVTIERAE